MVKFGTYAAVSSLLAAASVAFAFHTHTQFYPATIYLARSKINAAIWGNFFFMLAIAYGQLLKKMFFGSLNNDEVQRVVDNCKFAITETCLALTIFREELDVRTVALFASLIFMKIFHWICYIRVDALGFHQRHLSALQHLRLDVIMTCLMFTDAFIVAYIRLSAEVGELGVLLLFAFEYTILCTTMISTGFKYILLCIDARHDGRWPAKPMWMFCLNLCTDLIRLCLYTMFFLVVCLTFNSIPLHLIRDLYLTYNQLTSQIKKFMTYRKLVQNLDERFQDVTIADFGDDDRTCIICRDDMDLGKRLPCDHVFHLDCLRGWLQENQSCPTCRAVIPIDYEPPPRAPIAPVAFPGHGGMPPPPPPVAAHPGMHMPPPGFAQFNPYRQGQNVPDQHFPEQFLPNELPQNQLNPPQTPNQPEVKQSESPAPQQPTDSEQAPQGRPPVPPEVAQLQQPHSLQKEAHPFLSRRRRPDRYPGAKSPFPPPRAFSPYPPMMGMPPPFIPGMGSVVPPARGEQSSQGTVPAIPINFIEMQTHLLHQQIEVVHGYLTGLQNVLDEQIKLQTAFEDQRQNEEDEEEKEETKHDDHLTMPREPTRSQPTTAAVAAAADSSAHISFSAPLGNTTSSSTSTDASSSSRNQSTSSFDSSNSVRAADSPPDLPQIDIPAPPTSSVSIPSSNVRHIENMQPTFSADAERETEESDKGDSTPSAAELRRRRLQKFANVGTPNAGS